MVDVRPAPYDIIFATPGFDPAWFERLREEARAHPARAPDELFLLPASAVLLRELLPAAEAGAADAADEAAEAAAEAAEAGAVGAAGAAGVTHRELVEEARALFFHAFRFWLYGRRTWSLEEAALRGLLVRTAPVGEWSGRPPHPAGYVRFPRNLVWARVADAAPAEPVDGFFWSRPEEDGPPRLDLLFALGVRPSRPGISVVRVAVEALDALQQWADVEARPGGTDFGNMLPGGELQGYHGLLTRTEALKLAVRCFWLIEATGAPLPGAGECTVIGGAA
jgi:hypothetical protein